MRQWRKIIRITCLFQDSLIYERLQRFKRDNNSEASADQIVVSTGAKQSLLNVFLTLVNLVMR